MSVSDPGSFEFGPFRLDTGTRVLWRAEQIVPLTPKAVAVLEALVERSGDVVLKKELLARAWPDAAVQEANLSVTVAALRKALGSQEDGTSYIQTVSRRGYRFAGPLRPGSPVPRLALAVLPFACLGPETESHLGVGLADALIGRLTEADELRVRPTGAVVHYAALPRPPREAAAELGVDAVVAGTIQRAGERVRVSVQLVPLAAALRPWADSFDAEWTHLFTVQDELAERVARALHLRLASAPKPRRPRTPSREAYDSYLRGRYFWARFDPEGLGKAFGYFGDAISRDAEYAAPQAGLASAHLLLGMGGLTPPREAWDRAGACAERALRLDPSLAEAHLSGAFALLFRDWDWQGARTALDHAVSAGPRVASVHLWRALFLALAGDHPEARRSLEVGRDIDPLSGLATALLCLFHEVEGEHEEALALARKAVELRPDRFLGYWSLGLANVFLGHGTSAEKALGRAVELTSGGPVMRAHLAWAAARAGRTERARRELMELDALSKTTYISPCQRAAVLGALGEIDAGLSRIEEGAEERDAWTVFLRVDPLFEPYRGQARFESVVRRTRPGRPSP
jgi:DNA-binding winged helix-turn-helix (wHTH) protein/TolB-like protein/Tfp pilus assembly protein PilF